MPSFRFADIVRAVRLARAAFPREACGVLVGHRADACLSIRGASGGRNTPVSFRITASEIARINLSLANSKERILGYYHTHVFGAARPSRHDAAGTKRSGELWLIYSLRDRQMKLYQWTGRTFVSRRFRIAR